MSIDYKRLAELRNLRYTSWSLPYNPELKLRAREMRNNPTPEEAKLWRFLRLLPMRVLRQKPIDHYIVDFYIPSVGLVIEVDGSQHYLEEGSEHDSERDEALSLYGIRVLRIDNKAVRTRYQDVCDYIKRELGVE